MVIVYLCYEEEDGEREEVEGLLIFCPWLYTDTKKELKPLLHNNMIKHNTIVAGKNIRLLIFNFVLQSDTPYLYLAMNLYNALLKNDAPF